MITYDWIEYFKRFCLQHGGRHPPIEIGGRLVFGDGWAYSKDDYSGPEWPPPSDPLELLILQRKYWQQRTSDVRGDRNALAAFARNMTELQAHKTMPLVQLAFDTVRDAEGKTRKLYNPRDVDWGAVTIRLRMLNEDLDECEQMLRTLRVIV